MTLHTGRLTTLLTAALMFISLSSCSDKVDSPACPDGMGKVTAYLHSDIVIKSPETISEECSDYNFRFVGVDSYGSSEYYRYGDVTWPMDWYLGIYRLQAESCTRDEAEVNYGKLRYEGIGEPFSVINGQDATASVICSMANFQVKANFDDSMYDAFDAFKLTVQTVSAPSAEAEDDDETEEFVPVLYRSLDFDPIERSGYYNLHSEPLHLKYTLYIRPVEAEEYIEAAHGYFIDKGESTASIVEAADVITLNVKYTGATVVNDKLTFIINGTRIRHKTAVGLEDYKDGIASEDQ